MGYVAIIVIAMLGVALLVAVIGILVYLNERKRAERWQQAAAELAFEFLDKDEGLLAELGGFNLFSQGRRRKMRNLLRGTSSDTEVSIFDYRYTVGGGKNSTTHKQTAICFQSERLDLPDFELRPERWYHKIGTMFGYQDIDFSDFPEFSRKYILRGEDEQSVRDLFTAPVVEHFERLGGISAEGHGGRLVVYRHSRRVKPADVREFLEECFGVYSVLTERTAG